MNQRAIKFRVWNTITKTFTYFDTPQFDFVDGKPIVCFANDSLDGTVMLGGYENPEEFTGITDVNEQELYEGDVIEYCTGKIFVIEFDERAYFRLRNTTEKRPCGAYESLDFAQVEDAELNKIGNIHENPELLEVR